jgi:hypothetical protein
MTILMTGGDPIPDDYFYEFSEWVDCWNCGGSGFSHHDCGDDCCCCADPGDNVECDICDGVGGWDRKPTAQGEIDAQ